MGLGNGADDTGTFCMPKTSSPMTFTLKRVREDPDPAVSSDSPLKFKRRTLSRRHADCGSDDEKNLFRALRTKPWINYCDKESDSEDESDDDEVNCIARSSSLPLPVGVVRGCPSCEGCQKVLARWRPEAGCRPGLEDAPVFFPLEEEFRDTVKYIASISAEAEQYGICRIVPPHSWRPPCPLKDSEKRRTTKFPTRVQRLDKLQVREALAKKEERKRRGGRLSRSCKETCSDSSDEGSKFGFEPGPMFTLETFEKYAHQFKEEYFGLGDKKDLRNDSVSESEPSVECLEGEYWRIVEHATEQLEVLYGADIETGVFGSGFPKAKPGVEPSLYESSGWNLNNIARLGGSVLSFEEEDISGVLVPWLYVGMCLSSFCWHVEDHHFYSLNYMHFGSPKVWYGIPGNAAHNLENAMRKHLPDLFEEQPDLLHKLVTQLSPSVLKADGVPVYRAIQKPGEFVVTFPRAYHAGFNCGFNCAEAVNVAPIDWLPAGQNAIELYKQQKRKSTVSHDKLLLGAAKKIITASQQNPGLPIDADSFAQHKVLLKVLKDRMDLERSRRSKVEHLVHSRKMDKSFDSIEARECSVCHYDLHLSAIGCECARDRYTCLEHVQELCACEKSRKHALYRYEVHELDALVAALEGSGAAVGEVESLLQISTVPKASNLSSMEVNDLEGLTNEQNGGHSTVIPALLVLPQQTTTEDPQNATCPPVESLWSEGFKAMSSFLLEDFENYERSLASSNQVEISSLQGQARDREPSLPPAPGHSTYNLWSSEAAPNGHAPAEEEKSMLVHDEKKGLEVIVLSDDEEGLVVQPASSRLCAVNSTHGMMQKCDTGVGLNLINPPQLLPQEPVTNVTWRSIGSQSQQSNRPPVFVPQENAALSLTLQPTRPVHVSPSIYPILGDNGTKDASANKDWLCLGHLQTSSMDHGPYEFLTRNSFSYSSYEGQGSGNCVGAPAVGNALSGSVQGHLPLSQPKEVGVKVDLLNTGRLVLGMSWYNKDAIFPAGFRSGVLFHSILDPCQMCFYISEVLDYGHAQPLFKVVMEEYPCEVFIHGSIDRCWQMVQERVNMMIQLQLSLGKVELPCIRPPEDIRGLELFGFTSPHIIKAVESLDWRHQCLEYWMGRGSAVGLLRNQHHPYTAKLNDIGTAETAASHHATNFMVPLHQNQTALENRWSLNSMAMHNSWR